MESKKIKASALSKYGDTVCKDEQNTYFVEGLIPEETAFIHQIDNNWQIDEIIQTSTERVNPPCPYFNDCGGCKLQFMNIAAQRKYKFEFVKHTIQNYFKLEFQEYIDYSKDLPAYHYRERVNFHRRNKKLGFFQPKSNELVEIKECKLLKEKINNHLKEKNYYQDLNKNIEGVVLQLVDNQVLETFKTKNNQLLPQSNFPVGHFFQVNAEGNKKLQEIILKETSDTNITEFYAGAGNFSFLLAKKGISVIAIEADRKLVDFANKQNIANLRMICSTTEKYIKSNKPTGGILLDPPRSGAKALSEALHPASNPRIVYVSCNISTLGRDLKIISNKDYKLTKLYFIDMFPQTHHTECVAILDA